MKKDFLTITPDSGRGVTGSDRKSIAKHGECSLYHDNHFGGGVSLELLM